MAHLRVRHPDTLPKDLDLGPAVARPLLRGRLRIPFDVALATPRRKPDPVYLEQP